MIDEILKLLSTERGEGLLVFGSSRDEGFFMAEHASALMYIATFQRLQREWRGNCKSRLMTLTLGGDVVYDLRRVKCMTFDGVWATDFARTRMSYDAWAMVQSRLRQ